MASYNPKGDLLHTTKVCLIMMGINHTEVKNHSQRVALYMEETAKRPQKDPVANFFGGLLHDIGKLFLPFYLFDGRNISNEEYALVKEHAINGFKTLLGLHYFIALCAGLHHALYKAGYGLTINDFPKNWSLKTIKKVLEISMMISICDFIDAHLHRNTEMKDGTPKGDLETMLKEKFPDDHLMVETALAVARDLNI